MIKLFYKQRILFKGLKIFKIQFYQYYQSVVFLKVKKPDYRFTKCQSPAIFPEKLRPVLSTGAEVSILPYVFRYLHMRNNFSIVNRG